MLKFICILLSVLLSVAFLTVMERKYLSGMQRRRGPNVIGFYGLLQAIADGVKLIFKRSIVPSSVDSVLFRISPIISFITGVLLWIILPYSGSVVLVEEEIGLLLVLMVSSLGVFGVFLGGIGSNSKYGFLGGVRSTSQMISYEVSIGFILIGVVIFSGGSLNLLDLLYFQENCYNGLGLFPLLVLFMISILAETNRHPFDLPEAESELVSGYNVEYSGGSFVLFFLGEYSAILLMSSILVLLFISSVHSSVILSIVLFSVKVLLVVNVFILSRGGLPRYRYDQLIGIGWFGVLPTSLSVLIVIIGVVLCY